MQSTICDLKGVSLLQYRNRLRLGRWISGFFFALIAIGLGKTLLSGLNTLNDAVLVLGCLAELVLLFAVLYLLTPGPNALRVSPGEIGFTFPTGRELKLITASRRFSLKLVEKVQPSIAIRRVLDDPPFFVSVRGRWLPPPSEAFAAIQSELVRAGLASAQTEQINARYGGWRFLTYRARTPRSSVSS
jgi:hypothetical protein